jgi:single-stranded-DNA-specific exonuclease
VEYKLLKNYNEEENLSPIEKVLLNRGFNKNNIEKYLNPSFEYLEDPILLNNMVEGLNMLTNAINNNLKTLIVVDSDADGFTSSAILINYLYDLYPEYVLNNIEWYCTKGNSMG